MNILLERRILLSFFIVMLFLLLINFVFKVEEHIIERFSDGSPRLIHISRIILGKPYLLRTIEFWEKDKIRYDKEFKYGRPHGKQIFISKNGEKTIQWIKKGKRNGEYMQWDTNGNLILKEIWSYGKKKKTILKCK